MIDMIKELSRQYQHTHYFPYRKKEPKKISKQTKKKIAFVAGSTLLGVVLSFLIFKFHIKPKNIKQFYNMREQMHKVTANVLRENGVNVSNESLTSFTRFETEVRRQELDNEIIEQQREFIKLGAKLSFCLSLSVALASKLFHKEESKI